MEIVNRLGKLKLRLNMMVFLLCLVAGITGCATKPGVEPATDSLDTPEIIAELKKAQNLAGDDTSLTITQLLQCKTVAVGAANPDAYVEPTKLFDNLYFIGTPAVGSFIFTTTDGYIMIDAGFSDFPEKVIIPGMEKLGLDPSEIKYILITHAGPDHLGGANYFQKNYGAQIVMSKEEWIRAPKAFAKAESRPVKAEFQSADSGRNSERSLRAIVWPDQDIIGTDGQTLTLGDTTITMIHTPRRVNGGGLSYIAQVFDNGEPHMWATYGNTNVVGDLEDKKVYREAVAKFLTFVDEYKVDVVISSHPFVDGSTELIEKLNNRGPGEPNPFVYDLKRARQFFELLDQSAVVMTLRQEAGLDETGTKRLDQ